MSKNVLAIHLLPYFRLDLELKDHEGSTALWLAVQYITVSSDQSVNPFEDLPVVNGTSFDENSFAARLIQRGSNTNAPDVVSGKGGMVRAGALLWSLMKVCVRVLPKI